MAVGVWIACAGRNSYGDCFNTEWCKKARELATILQSRQGDGGRRLEEECVIRACLFWLPPAFLVSIKTPVTDCGDTDEIQKKGHVVRDPVQRYMARDLSVAA